MKNTHANVRIIFRILNITPPHFNYFLDKMYEKSEILSVIRSCLTLLKMKKTFLMCF